ncbi:MAG: SDR family oxidoreductase [Alphaproteobacteria bacterium]|nr:SDR family oxidoreductase [Alphaproteobacteria bacterium]
MTITYDFSGRTALVTGGAEGIGHGIAARFLDAGATVYAADINQALLEQRQAETPGLNTLVMDVIDTDSIETALETMRGNGHAPDILVHAAGGIRGQFGRDVSDVTDSDWHAVVDVNLTGMFKLTRALVPSMRQKGYGRIVIISSGAGFGTTLTGVQAYAAAKAGEIGLTRQFAHDLGADGITVNSVAPGFILCSADTRAHHAKRTPDEREAVRNRAVIPRDGQPEDIANAVLFFACEEADWITGQTLQVNGGR